MSESSVAGAPRPTLSGAPAHPFRPPTPASFVPLSLPLARTHARAGIALPGITPGNRQANSALKALRAALIAGRSAEEAARTAKQAASFKGEMRIEPL